MAGEVVAVITIVHKWDDGETITIQVSTNGSAYPDELHQLRTEAVSIYRELTTGECDDD